MKREYKTNSIETSGNMYRHQFRVDTNADMFQLVISNLYSRPIEAIIRELSCNAYDAHVDSGNQEKAFDIKLPNSLDHTFYIRDYGTGLLPDKIYNLYTVVGLSDKTKSDAFTGAFGVGSKSPFAYTTQFSVESIVDGTKWIYAAYMNEKNIPEIAELSNGGIPTTEANGLKISFDIKKNDWHEFYSACREVLRPFKLKPNIFGIEPNQVIGQPTEYRLSGDGWGLRAQSSYHKSDKNYAIMGNVAYQIDVSQLAGCPDIRGFDIFFNIGDLTPAASREYLQYDVRTVAAIMERMAKIEKECVKDFSKKINDAKTVQDARIIYQQLFHEYRWDSLFGPLIKKHASYKKDRKTYDLEKINFAWNELAPLLGEPNYVNVYQIDHRGSSGRIIRPNYSQWTKLGILVPNGQVERKFVEPYYVVADEKNYKFSKSKHFASSLFKEQGIVYLIETDQYDIIFKFLTALGVNPGNVKKVSELEKPPAEIREKAASKSRRDKQLVHIHKYESSKRKWRVADIWSPITEDDLKLQGNQYYVIRYNKYWLFQSEIEKNQYRKNINQMNDMLNVLTNFTNMPALTIYSITESKKDLLPKNWLPFEKFIESFYKWLLTGVSSDYKLTEVWPQLSTKLYKSFVNVLSTWNTETLDLLEDKEVSNWVKNIKNITDLTTKYRNFKVLQEFVEKLLGEKQTDNQINTDVTQDFVKFLSRFHSDYSMLEFVDARQMYNSKNTREKEEVIKYMNMMYKNKTENK